MDDNSPDTDGDGLVDGLEYSIGTDPRKLDTDGDGLNDGLEFNSIGTDPLDVDTDGDHLTDSEEYLNVFGTGFDPLLWSTEGDGLPDFLRADLTDTDEGGIPDRLEIHWGLDPADRLDDFGDIDGDGVRNLDEYLTGHDIWNGWLDSLDTDNDGMTDVFEIFFGLDRDDPTDAADDPDGDFLTNLEESWGYTSPLHYLTPGFEDREVFDRDDETGEWLLDSEGEYISRQVTSDYESVMGMELSFINPGLPPLVRDNGPDPDREWEDDWDQDGISNRDEVCPPYPEWISPSDPRVYDQSLTIVTPSDLGRLDLPNYYDSFELMAEGGRTGNYRWSSQNLPEWLTLDANGWLWGPTPEQEGTCTFTAKVESYVPVAGEPVIESKTATFTFHYGEPQVCLECGTYCGNTCTICNICWEDCDGWCWGTGGSGTVGGGVNGYSGPLTIYGAGELWAVQGEPFVHQFTSNGAPTRIWTLGANSAGVDFGTSWRGELSGIPETLGTHTFTVQLQDGFNRMAYAPCTLHVLPPAVEVHPDIHLFDLDLPLHRRTRLMIMTFLWMAARSPIPGRLWAVCRRA